VATLTIRRPRVHPNVGRQTSKCLTAAALTVFDTIRVPATINTVITRTYPGVSVNETALYLCEVCSFVPFVSAPIDLGVFLGIG
jgi:hypothetical protein